MKLCEVGWLYRQQSLDVSGQKLTYAQIIQKKKEKEAKEAAERAAKEAEENQGDASNKGKADDKVATAAPAESEPAAPVKKEEAAASGQPGPAAAVERQDSRQSGGKHGGNHATGGGHARLAKTNSATGGDKGGQQVADKRSANSQRQVAANIAVGQPNHNKRTERPKSPSGAAKWRHLGRHGLELI